MVALLLRRSAKKRLDPRELDRYAIQTPGTFTLLRSDTDRRNLLLRNISAGVVEWQTPGT